MKCNAITVNYGSLICLHKEIERKKKQFCSGRTNPKFIQTLINGLMLKSNEELQFCTLKVLI